MNFQDRYRQIVNRIAGAKAQLEIKLKKEEDLFKKIKNELNLNSVEEAEKRLKDIDAELLKNETSMQKLLSQIEEELNG